LKDWFHFALDKKIRRRNDVDMPVQEKDCRCSAEIREIMGSIPFNAAC